MLNVLKNINSSTMLVEEDNQVFIAKVISADDLDLYKSLLSIDNPNVVRFINTEIIDEKLCVVEEYLQGETLENYVKNNAPLSDEQIYDIVLQICNGLEEIHNKSIVHRDINPSNIMVCDGVIKLIDFGISRINRGYQSQDTRILGTQGYTAPEQFGFSQTNARADIYSLGVVINYLKTQSLPSEHFCGGALGNIVSKCTQIDESRRYNTIDEIVDDVIKKNRIRSVLGKIPGYRKKVWWHILIASLYYAAYALIFYVCVDISKNFEELISYIGMMIFVFALPVLILTNFLNWTDKISWIKNKARSSKITIQLLFSILSAIIGCGFIILFS